MEKPDKPPVVDQTSSPTYLCKHFVIETAEKAPILRTICIFKVLHHKLCILKLMPLHLLVNDILALSQLTCIFLELGAGLLKSDQTHLTYLVLALALRITQTRSKNQNQKRQNTRILTCMSNNPCITVISFIAFVVCLNPAFISSSK